MSKVLEEAKLNLAQLRQEIKYNQDNVDSLKKQEKELIEQLQILEAQEQPMMSATNLWCKISNAIIAKYKPMSEENPEEAVKQLTRMEGALIAGGFLTDLDLERAL